MGMRQLLPPIEDRTEWLTERRKGIGASDVAGILGLSTWDTPTSIWIDKLGLADPDDDTTSDAMWHGRYAETVIAEWYADTHDAHVAGAQWRAVGLEPWHNATLDSLTFESEKSRFRLNEATSVLECKAVGAAPNTWELDGIPIAYKCQGIWQVICTGIPTVNFAVVHVAWGRLQFRAYSYTPTDSDIDFVTTKVTEFWQRNVIGGTPPPADAHPATTVALQHAWGGADVADDDLIEATPELVELCEQVDAARAVARDAKNAAAALENRLRSVIGAHTGIRNDDGTGATWKPSNELDVDAIFATHPDIASQYRIDRLDIEAFRQAHPDIADRHTARTGSRRLNITRPKKKKEPTP